MKITNDQLQALHQQDPARRKNKIGTEGFESLFSDKLNAEGAQDLAFAAMQKAGINPAAAPLILETPAETPELSLEDGLLRSTAGRLDGLFSQLESYGAELSKAGGADLRAAYGMLSGMSKEIAGIKAGVPDLASRSPDLAALVNELDVLAVTETFKFNRGDYL